MAFSWLVNGGDPNHLRVLAWSSKYVWTLNQLITNTQPPEIFPHGGSPELLSLDRQSPRRKGNGPIHDFRVLQLHRIYGRLLLHELPSLKLTFLPLKIGLPNRKVVFKPSIFRGYVSFREGKSFILHFGWYLYLAVRKKCSSHAANLNWLESSEKNGSSMMWQVSLISNERKQIPNNLM